MSQPQNDQETDRQMKLVRTGTKTYIVYYHDTGYMNREASTEKVDSRTPRRHARSAPATAFAFYYYDTMTAVVEVGGKKIELESEPTNKSKLYYIDADVRHISYLERNSADYAILLANMRDRDCEWAVQCRNKRWWELWYPGEAEVIRTHCSS